MTNNNVSFNDVTGSVAPLPDELKKFLAAWYGTDDHVMLVAIPADSSGKRQVLSQAIKSTDLYNLDDEDLNGLTRLNGQKLNTYISVNPVKDDHKISLKSRGGNRDTKEIRGVFIDLDWNSPMKPNEAAFPSKEEALKFLETIPQVPTVVVDNGPEGGIHAYWRINDLAGKNVKDHRGIMALWWSYVNEMSPYAIDRLIDPSRISRMPGGIYWGDRAHPVRVLSATGANYSFDHLKSLCEPYEAAYRARIDAENIEMQKLSGAMSEFTNSLKSKSSGLNQWQIRIADTLCEEWFNEHVSWDDILPKHGWTMLRENFDGSRQWARPGRGTRSATTDYFDEDKQETSPVMSLLTTAEETGLCPIKEAGQALTKFRVTLKLDYNNDLISFYKDILERMNYDGEN